MLADQQKQLEDRIREKIFEGRFEDKKIYVFGSNEPAERIIDELEIYHCNVTAMLDNNVKKKSFTYRGVPVFLPSEALEPYQEDAVILIASKYYDEMVRQLTGMGYDKKRQIIQIVAMETGSYFSLDQETWDQELEKLKKGTQVLKRLKDTYGEDVNVFIFPWQAIGDIYMAARYLKAYIAKLEQEQGMAAGKLNYIITVMGKVRQRVAGTCGYEKIEVLTGEESKNLCRAVVFLGYQETKAQILQHRFVYTNKIWKLGNYKNINFDDHFRYSIYGLDEDCEVVTPKACIDIRQKKQNADWRDDPAVVKQLDEIFCDYFLEEGNTVILSPYANTVTNPSKEFWQDLVIQLKEQGYVVCTNSCGSTEPAIPGTLPVFIPFDVTIPAIEKAGFFVGLRSGLCDFVACAKAKKIIIYPNRIYVNGPVIQFYSLNKMGLCSDAFEYVYDDMHPERTLKEVVHVLEEQSKEINFGTKA